MLGTMTMANVAAQVTGVVRDQGTFQPVSGAMVTLQATTTRAVSDSSGSFSLSGASGENLIIVASKKSYYSGSVQVSTPASDVLILVQSVPQDSNVSYSFTSPTTCGSCHPDQFSQWTNSPMALGGRNTWLYDTYNGTGTPGGMGGFVYTRDSRFAMANPASECASCHQPEPWIKTPFSALEDFNNPSPGALHGVSCDVCHKVAHMDESRPNFPGMYPGVVTVTRPNSSSRQVEYGVLGDASFTMTGTMRPSFQPQLTAVLCAACHQDKNDPDQDGDFEEANGIISEPTYGEWLDSPYGDPESTSYASCVGCHMPSYGATTVCQTLMYIPPIRDSETIRGHRIEGTTPAFLENSVELAMSCQPHDSVVAVEVRITNSGTGHHVPTGVTVRNMILLVEAWRESDSSALGYLGTETVHALGGVGDPAGGYYSGLPGKLYAKVIHDSSGHFPTFFTDAAGFVFDNRIPALATDTTYYAFSVPPEGGTYHVRARLIYRRAFRALVDAKGWLTDGHGAPLEDVLPPYYGHLMEEISWVSGTSDVTGPSALPGDFGLEQNYPNPFNPSTVIKFNIPASKAGEPGSSFVTLKVYDLLGREVNTLVSEKLQQGNYEATFDATGFASGVFLYRLQWNTFTDTKKLLLLR